MNAIVNGKSRKSLASQLDRLDATLDGLSAGLNEAIAAAVKEAVTVAVREAVQAVVTEVISNPQLLAQFQPAVPPTATNDNEPDWAEIVEQPTVSAPARLATMRSWLNQKMQAIRQTCRSAVIRALGTTIAVAQRAQKACIAVRHSVTDMVSGSWQRFQLMRHRLLQLATAVGVGVALATVAYCAQPWLAAAVGGLTGLALAWLIQVGLELRRRARLLLGLGKL
jgi:hypothetical protein